MKKPKNVDTTKKSKTGMSYKEERDLQTQKTVKIFAWGLLITMGLTLISWSMLGFNGNNSIENGGTITFTSGLFQDPFSGEVYDGAVINGVQFIFYEDVTQYGEDRYLQEISSRLLNVNTTVIYEIIDETFQNDDARFLISQGLQANNYFTTPNNDTNCTSPTLVYTTLDSNISYSQNCIIFESNITQSFSLANGLTYHLIKDIK